MAKPERIRVAVLYGGRSSEHEVSLLSARSVIEHLDRERFEVLPVAIDRDGRWYPQELRALQASPGAALPANTSVAPVTLEARPGAHALLADDGSPVDVVFPVMHGPLCEDGSIQGLLELADLPYVGSGVAGSAVCMDKDLAKRLAAAAGVRSTAYLAVRDARWQRDRAGVTTRVQSELGYPVFVKPANLGSSVGIRRVADATELGSAVDHAFEFDTKVLVERAVDAREIELAVLGSLDPAAPPEVSLPGEIVADDAFYSFERKYLEESGASLHIPADLTPTQCADAQAIARQLFIELECEGMARVDLFLDRRSGTFLFNEVNTIPGFTAISMYPKLWEASGLGYRELLTRLVELALARGARRASLKRERSPRVE